MAAKAKKKTVKSSKKTTVKKDFHQEITDKIIAMLKTADGSRPWFVGKEFSDLFAYNPAGKRFYGGFINTVLLNFTAVQKNYKMNRWMTFKQGEEAGANIRKGEKGTQVFFADKCYFTPEGEFRSAWVRDLIKKKGAEGKRIVARMVANEKLVERYYDKFYTVFNLDQFDNVRQEFFASEADNMEELKKDEGAELILDASGADIRYSAESRAYYTHSADFIHLPIRESFTSSEAFYEVAFHELTHWTGAEHRLARKSFVKEEGFVDSKPEQYAFEELVAELGSAYLMAGLGMEKRMENAAAYINSWLQELENDNTFIFKAAALADNAARFLKGKAETKEEGTGTQATA